MTLPHPFKLKGARNVFLDTMKRGEDDHFSSKSKQAQTVILRLYEAYGGHAAVTIETPLPVESATICDVSSLSLSRSLGAHRSPFPLADPRARP